MILANSILLRHFVSLFTIMYLINSKYEFLVNRTMDLNDRLDEVISQSTSKFNIIKDNVSLIINYLNVALKYYR